MDTFYISSFSFLQTTTGMSCGVPYLGRVTPPNLRATLVNKTPFQLKVKRKYPCNKTTGTDIVVFCLKSFYSLFLIFATIKHIY